MKQWEVAFTGSWPAALVVPGAAVAVVLAWLLYRARREELSRKGFLLLTALRVTAIAIVALFILQPVVRFTRTETTRATVAVLLDASESMGIRDAAEDRSRFEAALSLLRGEPADLLRRAGRTQEVKLYAFGAVTTEIEPGQLAELAPTGKASALGEALQDAVRRVGEGSASAVVVLTDGVANRGDDPQRVARTLGVPVFPVALGGRPAERGRFRDIGLREVPQDAEFVVNNRARVEVEISHAGLNDFTESERTLTLRLLEGERELASTTVVLPAEDGTQRAELEFVPERKGVHRLRAALPALPGEAVQQNNVRSFTALVTDPRIRVLIVEGVVRSEYRFLRRVLESDPSLDVTSVVKISGNRYLVQGVDSGVDLSRGLPARREDYGKFDVIVLGDAARDEFSGHQVEQLRDYVDDGGAVAALGGRHAFGAGGWADSALADVLPVRTGGERDGRVDEPFVPAVTPEGARHPVLEGCRGFFEGTRTRVSLDGANRVLGAKPGASALLVHPSERAAAAPMPVLAVQQYGSGRTMAMTSDTTWKWKFQVEARGMDSPYYRFWRQSMRWLAGRDVAEMAPEQYVSAWPVRVEYEPDRPVTIKAKVRNPDREPEDGAAVEVEVRYPTPVQPQGAAEGGQAQAEATLTLLPVPLSPGEYQTTWRPPAPGLYRAAATATLEGEHLGSDTFEFVVSPAASEFERIAIDETTLRNLAARTGGSFHTLATAGRIPEELKRRRRLVMRHEELSLWNAPWFFAAFLACVTAEWILRKRRGLN